MGGAPCGISLSDVCLMTPIKSISGIIGIGPEVDEKNTVASIVNWKPVINEKERRNNGNTRMVARDNQAKRT